MLNKNIILSLIVGMVLISFVSASIDFKEKGWYLVSATGNEARELSVNPTSLTSFEVDLKDRGRQSQLDTKNIKLRLYEVICGDIDYLEECREIDHTDELKKNTLDVSSKKALLKVPFAKNYYLDIGEHTITYSAGTNTIVVLGNATYCNETIPCNFTDLYNADVSGGWGVVFRQGDRQFFINATLEIGNESVIEESWFADEEKQITFGYGEQFIGWNDSFLQFGRLDNETYRSTSGGCSFFTDFDSINDKFRIDGSFELYSSTLLNSDNSRGMFYLSPDSASSEIRMWNVRMSGLGYVYQFGTFNMTAHNWVRGNLENNDRGLSLTTGNFPPNHFEDTVVQHSNYGVRNTWLGYYGDENITLRNLWLKDSLTADYDFFHWGTQGHTADFYVIDGISDWTFHWSSCNDSMSKFHRQYSFNLLVQDESGNAVNLARVRVWDNKSNLVVDVYTNATGKIDEQVIEYGFYHPDGGNTLNASSPHTLLITKVGYNNIDSTWTMDEPIDWILTFVDPCFPNTDYDYASNFPMSWNNGGNKLTIWGDDGTGGKTAMGYDADHPITLENITAFAYYTKGVCIVEKNEEGVYNIKSRLIIGDDVNETHFVSERENVYQYDYFKVRNNASFRMGTNMNNTNNPFMTPKWGSKWIIDRDTLPEPSPDWNKCFFVETGGSLRVYDSYIGLTNNSKAWDTQTGAFTLFDTSTFGCYDRMDTTYIRFWGDLEYHDLTLHHCRNMNFPNPPTANSTNLFIYSNQNALQVKDAVSWIFNAVLSNNIICDIKVLQGGNAHVVDTALDLLKMCRPQTALKVWVRKSFKLRVVDENSNPIENVNVTLANKDGLITNDSYGVRGFSKLTNATGYVDFSNFQAVQIAEPVGTGDPTSGGFNALYPFTLTLEKEDYQNESYTWDFIDTVNWEVTLLNETIPYELDGTLIIPKGGGIIIRKC